MNNDIVVVPTWFGQKSQYYARCKRGGEVFQSLALGISPKSKDNRREAERQCAKIEARLRQGLPARAPADDDAAGLVKWDVFQKRAEQEYFAPRSASYASSWRTAANAFKRATNPRYLQDATTAAVSRFTAYLHATGYSKATINSYLTTLAVGLGRYAAKVFRANYHAPDIDKPERAARKARGRPLCKEEFDRLLRSVEKVVPAEAVDDWKAILWGMVLGGFRIGELHALRWNDGPLHLGDIDQPKPLLYFHAETHKGKRDEEWPLPPDLIRRLQRTPPRRRRGYVFNPRLKRGRVGYDTTKKTIATIGEKAKIRVGEKTAIERDDDGQPTGRRVAVTKYASSHDLRRTFAQRWWKRLQSREQVRLLCRHRAWQTTDTYYLNRATESLVDALWSRFSNPNSNPRRPEASRRPPKKRRKSGLPKN